MAIDSKQIEHLSQLARLKSDADSNEVYANQLSGILDLIEKMNAVDTDGVEPMHHPQDATLRLRDDVVTAENQRETFQAIAPATENGLYLVPKVIE